MFFNPQFRAIILTHSWLISKSIFFPLYTSSAEARDLSLFSVCSSLFLRFTMVLVIFSLQIFAFSIIYFSLSTTFWRRFSLRSRRCFCLLSELFSSSLKNKIELSLLRLFSSCRNWVSTTWDTFFFLPYVQRDHKWHSLHIEGNHSPYSREVTTHNHGFHISNPTRLCHATCWSQPYLKVFLSQILHSAETKVTGIVLWMLCFPWSCCLGLVIIEGRFLFLSIYISNYNVLLYVCVFAYLLVIKSRQVKFKNQHVSNIHCWTQMSKKVINYMCVHLKYF